MGRAVSGRVWNRREVSLTAGSLSQWHKPWSLLPGLEMRVQFQVPVAMVTCCLCYCVFSTRNWEPEQTLPPLSCSVGYFDTMKYKEKDQVLNFYMLHFILKIHGIFLNIFYSGRCSEHWRQAFPLFSFFASSFRTKKMAAWLYYLWVRIPTIIILR